MTTPKKTIMRSLTIKELSGVDRPAQIGARALIMKRADDSVFEPPDDDELTPEAVADLIKRGKAALTDSVDGHTHLVYLEDYESQDVVSGITSWQDDHAHPWIMQENGQILIGEVDGHTHAVDAVSKTDPGTGETEMTPEEKAAQEKLEAENKALTAKAERLEKIAALNDSAKAHFEKLADDEKDAFLKLSADEQNVAVDKAKKAATDADPVVYTTKDGVELRKSAGAAVIEMAKSNDLLREQNEELRKKQEQAEFEKRAEAELPHLPGTVEERASMLKAIDSIEDEDQRKAAHSALKANNEAMSHALKNRGTGTPPTEGSADDKLDKLAKAEQEKNPKLSYEQAYDKVLKTPQGSELYEKSLN